MPRAHEASLDRTAGGKKELSVKCRAEPSISWIFMWTLAARFASISSEVLAVELGRGPAWNSGRVEQGRCWVMRSARTQFVLLQMTPRTAFASRVAPVVLIHCCVSFSYPALPSWVLQAIEYKLSWSLLFIEATTTWRGLVLWDRAPCGANKDLNCSFTAEGCCDRRAGMWIGAFIRFVAALMEPLEHYLAQERFVTQHQKQEQTCRCVLLWLFIILSAVMSNTASPLHQPKPGKLIKLWRKSFAGADHPKCPSPVFGAPREACSNPFAQYHRRHEMRFGRRWLIRWQNASPDEVARLRKETAAARESAERNKMQPPGRRYVGSLFLFYCKHVLIVS